MQNKKTIKVATG